MMPRLTRSASTGGVIALPLSLALWAAIVVLCS